MQRTCRHLASVALAFMLLSGGLAGTARAEDNATKYKLHAVFLYNFISSVEWPKLVYSGSVKNIDICIIGKDPMGAVLDAVAAKAETKGDVKINVRRDVSALDVVSCNIAYIAADINPEIALAKAKEGAVLTVSESKGFAKTGGIIEFVMKGTGVSFNVNNREARAYGLKISPQLLEVASEVEN